MSEQGKWAPITSADVRAGMVASRFVYDVEIVPSLRVNTLTLYEAMLRNARRGERLLNREEALRLGYPADEIASVFGEPVEP
jgi:hypothetical protein